MNKHAYLILAHNSFYILEKLLKLLDYEKNDIYIHIDKKVKDFDFDYYNRLVNKSTLKFVRRFNIRWGGYNQVRAEVELLNVASRNNYVYYHIISGVDLPLKSQSEIHKFLDKNKGKEFISIERISRDSWRDVEIKNRIRLYHFFDKWIDLRNKSIFTYILKKIDSYLLTIQVKFGVNRYPHDIWYGSNWCSITNECVKYVLSNKNYIKKTYRYSHAADELFIQNIVAQNRRFMNNIYKDDVVSNVRLIDWDRGTPYVFKNEDFIDLINSKSLFARKFDINIDIEVVDNIYGFINCKD